MSKNVEIFAREQKYAGFVSLQELKLRHKKFNGEWSEKQTRIVADRGDAACALLYLSDTEKYVFVEQFRLPVYEAQQQATLLELIAGGVEAGEAPAKAISREIEEEAGYQVSQLEQVQVFFTSPGGLTERMYLFYAEALEANKQPPRPDAGEDLKLHYYTQQELLQLLPKLQDAKTIVGVQWALLNINRFILIM